MMQTRTHKLATEAYRRVAERKGKRHENAYSSLAHSFPSMILQNGLAQATGFLLAKGRGEHKALLADLNAVLRAVGAVTSADGDALHRTIIGADLSETMQLTRHALDASAWIKRYSQGLLEREGGERHSAGNQ